MIEIISKRQLNTKTYDLGMTPEGKLRRACNIQQGLHYPDWDSGELFDCDPTLTVDTSAEPFSHECKKIQLPFKLDKATGKRRIYPVRGDKTKYIEFGGFPLTLSAANVSGKEMTWDKTNFSLSFKAIPEGIKFEAVLKNPLSPTSFSFAVTLNNLTWDNWQIKDGDKVVCVVQKGYATDASEEPIHRPLTATYKNGIATFGLDTVGMVYPVVVDPNITIQPATGDTYLYKYTPDTAYGSNSAINIRESSGNFTQRGLFYWDFSASVPAGSTIDTSTLTVVCDWTDAAQSIKVSRILQTAWTEVAATWNTYDGTNSWNTVGCGGSGTDYTTINEFEQTTIAAGNCTWTVTGMVQTALDDVSGVIHFRMTSTTTDVVTAFRSSNYTTASLRPKLYIEYTVDIEKQVSASSDDAYVTGSSIGRTNATAIASLSQTYTDIGYNGVAYCCSGHRFAGVTIPSGATVDGAILKVYSSSNYTVSNVVIYGEQNNNAATFSTLADFKARSATAASINIASWTVGAYWDGKDVTSIIQELVNDYSGLSSANIVLFIDSQATVSSYIEPRSYDYSGNLHGAILEINYTGGGGTVAKDVIAKYHMRALASKTLIGKYNLRALASKQLIAKYNIIAQVYKELIAKYNLRVLAGKATILKYNLFNLVSRTLITKYNIFQLAAKQLTAKYNIQNLISKIIILKYNLLNLASKTLVTKYNIFQLAFKEVIAKYNICSLTTKMLLLKYNIRGLAAKSVGFVYNILSLYTVAKELFLKYNLFNLAGKATVLKYHVRELVSKANIFKYNLRGVTEKALIIKYSINNLATKALGIVYNILVFATVAKELIIKYGMRSVIASTAVFKYNLRALISKSAVVKYNIRVLADKTLIAKYNLANLAAKTVAFKYHIRVLISKSSVFVYNILGLIAVEVSLVIKYSINQLASKSRIVKYNLLNLAGKQGAFIYCIKELAGKSLVLKYNSIGRVVTELIIKYRIREFLVSAKIFRPSAHSRTFDPDRHDADFEVER